MVIRSELKTPKRTVWRNYVFTCYMENVEKCMEEIRAFGVFEKVHTPTVEIKIRTGKERKREVRTSVLMPGYFFGRTKLWEPLIDIDKVKYSAKLMTTEGWGWCRDEEIERVSGLRVDRPVAKIPPKLSVNDKALFLGYAFKDMPAQRVIEIKPGEGLLISSPLFGGVPVRVGEGNSGLTKSRV